MRLGIIFSRTQVGALVCADDSTSMKYADNGERIDDLKLILERITSVRTNTNFGRHTYKRRSCSAALCTTTGSFSIRASYLDESVPRVQ